MKIGNAEIGPSIAYSSFTVLKTQSRVLKIFAAFIETKKKYIGYYYL